MTLREIQKKWQGNKRYTLKLVEAMPEEFYEVKPIDGVKSFGSQVSHITTWLRTHSRFVTGVEFEKFKGKDKASLLSALSKFFDSFEAFLNGIDPQVLDEEVDLWYGKSSKARVITVMDNHLSHHRGQMVMYLRFQGIKPPAYVGW